MPSDNIYYLDEYKPKKKDPPEIVAQCIECCSQLFIIHQSGEIQCFGCALFIDNTIAVPNEYDK